MFSSVSFIKGRTGVIQTTVGIPLSCIFSSTSIRRFVLQTFGSSIRHRSSSKVVRVICTTHFADLLISSNRSISRRIRSDFVCTAAPKPLSSMILRHLLVSFSSSSQCIYGSDIAPVPIMHFSLFDLNAFSNSSGAFCLTSISSKGCVN